MLYRFTVSVSKPSGGGQCHSLLNADRCIRRIVCAVLILLFTSFPLFSSAVSWTWTTPDSAIRYYRYQLNGEKDDRWTVIDSTEGKAVIHSSGRNVLHIQSSYDGNIWSESTVTAYTKPLAISLRINSSPYTYTYCSFYNGHSIEGAKDTLRSAYGCSFSIEADFTIEDKVRLYTEAGYALSMKEETVIPGERDVHYVRLGGGLDLTLSITDRISMYLGYGAGALFHINNNKANVTAICSARLGMDYILTAHLTAGAFARVNLAYSDTKNRLTDSMTVLFTPLSVSLSYMF